MRPNRFAIHSFFAVALALAATLLLTTTAHAQPVPTIWFVDVDGPGGIGDDWDTAFDNLQAALEAAEVSEGSDLIKIAQGTYKPSVPHCPDCDPGDITDRHNTFLLDFIQVTIEGGYKGCPGGVCENPDDRDIEQYETILSGDLLGDDGPEPFQNSEENAYHVVKVQDVDASVRIDGCTITAGHSEVIDCPDPGGCPPTHLGGGILVLDASPIVDRCTIKANQANLGGGMAVINGSPVASRCTFSSNTSFEGGALHITGTSYPAVINTFFIGNSAVEGGAIHTETGDAGGTFLNCLFSGNSAVSHGGAIDSGANSPAVFELINCTLAGNWVSAPGPGDGEGGGAIYTHVTGLVSITNCILWDNLVGNDPQQIYDPGGLATVTFSDVQDDVPGDGDVWPGTDNIDLDPLFFDPDGVDDIPGNEDDDYHLLVASPCIDKGNPEQGVDNCDGPGLIPCDVFDLDGDGVEMEPTPDLDLRDRVVDGDAMQGPMVDMGAYEYCEPEPCPWDLNGSCDVGILDLLALLAAWHTDPGGPPDFDGNGTVDIFDLLTLIANWGACPGQSLCPCVPVASEPSLEEVLTEAGLSMDDWDLLLDILHSGNNEAIDNALCWFGRYINGCPVDCSQLPACGGADPFNECPGDFNGDCEVDSADLTILLGCWGMPCGDLTGDCTTDGADLTILLGNWGPCPQAPFLCGPGPELSCGESAQGGGGGSGGSSSSPSLTAALAQMGFASVGAYQDWLIDASDSETFVCACVLQAVLEAQP